MKNEIREFLDESVAFELRMSDLYQFFYARFPEDSQFWWDISVEELNHASLIRTIDDLFFPEGLIPEKEIKQETERIGEINRSILRKIIDFRKNNPTRKEAFLYAFDLENSSGEIHFDLFMNKLPKSSVEVIFHKLNGEDKNHAMKISDYMKSQNIS